MMALETPVPIYFMIADLAGSTSAPGVLRSRLKRLDPFKNSKGSKKLLSLYHFAPLKHWGVRVRDYCYEVNSRQTPEGKREIVLHNQMHITEWEQMSREKKVSWESIEVGATAESDETISKQADLVWNDRLKVKYKLLSQNCQNFAYCLYRTIAVEPEKIEEQVRRSWKRIPNRITQVKTVLKRMAPMLARGLVIEGLEFITLEGAAIIGLEVVGLSLLGPVGEIILIAAVIAPFFLAKSKDKKWVSKVEKMMKSNKKQPAALADAEGGSQSDALTEMQMEEIIREFAEQQHQQQQQQQQEQRQNQGKNNDNINTTSFYKLDKWESPQDSQTHSTQTTTPSSPGTQSPNESRYRGYNKDSINRYTRLGFTTDHVAAVFTEWGIDPSGGEYFSFNEPDHQLVIESLLGRYGFDEVLMTSEVFTVPRKPLPEATVTEHWVGLVENDKDLVVS